MADYKVEGNKLCDRGGNMIAYLDNNFFRDKNGNMKGVIVDNYIKDSSYNIVGRFDGGDIMDSSGNKIGTIDDVRKLNPKCSFPTIVIGGKVIIGFNEPEIREALGL